MHTLIDRINLTIMQSDILRLVIVSIINLFS